jgi:hypothetical protein
VLESTAWTAPLAYKIKCFIGANSETQMLEQVWTFCNTGKCLPCFEAKVLSDVKAVASGELFYSSDTNYEKQKFGDFNTFFTSLDENSNNGAYPYCATAGSEYARYSLETCTLMKQGCLESYDGSHITMDPTKPYTMTMDNNVLAGYSETFCIKCSTGEGIYQTFENTVTQKPKVVCSTHITKNAAVPLIGSTLDLVYDSAGTTNEVGFQDDTGSSS